MKNTEKHTNENPFLAKWLAGELLDTDLQKLVSKEDFIAFKKIKKGLDAYRVLETPLEKSFRDLETKLESKKSVKIIHLYKKWAFSIAASLLLFVGLNYFFKTNTILYKTSFGEQKTFALQDGSEVILNANSTISFNPKQFKNKRIVYLQGEAFFKVKKDQKPFEVKTKTGTVQVLGTQFNVRSFSDYFQVHCYSGKVKVVYKKGEKILLPNEVLSVLNGKNVHIAQNIHKSPLWIHGETSFKSTPVKYVFIALKNQYNMQIDDTKIDKNILFTGTFPNNNQDVALKIVLDALQLKAIKKENTIILEKK